VERMLSGSMRPSMKFAGENGMTHTSWDMQVIYDRTVSDAGSYRLGKTLAVDRMQWS